MFPRFVKISFLSPTSMLLQVFYSLLLFLNPFGSSKPSPTFLAHVEAHDHPSSMLSLPFIFRFFDPFLAFFLAPSPLGWQEDLLNKLKIDGWKHFVHGIGVSSCLSFNFAFFDHLWHIFAFFDRNMGRFHPLLWQQVY